MKIIWKSGWWCVYVCVYVFGCVCVESTASSKRTEQQLVHHSSTENQFSSASSVYFHIASRTVPSLFSQPSKSLFSVCRAPPSPSLYIVGGQVKYRRRPHARSEKLRRLPTKPFVWNATKDQRNGTQSGQCIAEHPTKESSLAVTIILQQQQQDEVLFLVVFVCGVCVGTEQSLQSQRTILCWQSEKPIRVRIRRICVFVLL